MKQYFQKEPIGVDFYLDGEKFAGRTLLTIPRIGEEVRFNGIVYKIINLIHFYDEEFFRIGLTIRPLKSGE